VEGGQLVEHHAAVFGEAAELGRFAGMLLDGAHRFDGGRDQAAGFATRLAEQEEFARESVPTGDFIAAQITGVFRVPVMRCAEAGERSREAVSSESVRPSGRCASVSIIARPRSRAGTLEAPVSVEGEVRRFAAGVFICGNYSKYGIGGLARVKQSGRGCV